MRDSLTESDMLQAAKILAEAGTLVLSTHENSDGDSVGSLLGLSLAMRRHGAMVYPLLPNGEQIPSRYRFLPGKDLVAPEAELPATPPVFVALDCGNLDRLSNLRELAENSSLLVNIDHHEDNSHFGDINLVEPRASSTCEIVYRLLRSGKLHMGKEEAVCFYAGILTDTGRFRNANTSPQTMRVAAELLEMGVSPEDTVARIYEKYSLPLLQLKGRVLERARMADGCPLVYSYITLDDLRQTGVSASETEDIVDCLKVVEGASVVLLLKEIPDGKIRGSLRSRAGISVGKVARALGGGGHEQAAGFVADMSMQKILSEVCRLLMEREDG